MDALKFQVAAVEKDLLQSFLANIMEAQ